MYLLCHQSGIISNEPHQHNYGKTGSHLLRLNRDCTLPPYSRRECGHSKDTSAGTKYAACPGVRHSFDVIVSRILRISDRSTKEYPSCYFDFTNGEHTDRIHPAFHSRPMPLFWRYGIQFHRNVRRHIPFSRFEETKIGGDHTVREIVDLLMTVSVRGRARFLFSISRPDCGEAVH